MGVVIGSRRGQGYALDAPLELLTADGLLAATPPGVRGRLEELAVAFSIDSTSARLLAEPAAPGGTFRALFAEYQTGGRGRRGRRWVSPLGRGLCFSLSWTWPAAPRDLAAVSLVVGVSVAETLERNGVPGVSLKWPNDLIGQGGKLGGILVDVAGEPAGALKVVVGIGINLRGSSELSAELAGEAGALPPAFLEDLAGRPLARARLGGELLGGLIAELDGFAAAGFLPCADRWRRRDWLYGREVTVSGTGMRQAGRAAGIAPDGSLLLERDGRIVTVLAGDVSLREVP